MHKYELNNLRDIIPKSLNECSDSVYVFDQEFGVWMAIFYFATKKCLFTNFPTSGLQTFRQVANVE